MYWKWVIGTQSACRGLVEACITNELASVAIVVNNCKCSSSGEQSFGNVSQNSKGEWGPFSHPSEHPSDPLSLLPVCRALSNSLGGGRRRRRRKIENCRGKSRRKWRVYLSGSGSGSAGMPCVRARLRPLLNPTHQSGSCCFRSVASQGSDFCGCFFACWLFMAFWSPDKSNCPL